MRQLIALITLHICVLVIILESDQRSQVQESLDHLMYGQTLMVRCAESRVRNISLEMEIEAWNERLAELQNGKGKIHESAISAKPLTCDWSKRQ